MRRCTSLCVGFFLVIFRDYSGELQLLLQIGDSRGAAEGDNRGLNTAVVAEVLEMQLVGAVKGGDEQRPEGKLFGQFDREGRGNLKGAE